MLDELGGVEKSSDDNSQNSVVEAVNSENAENAKASKTAGEANQSSESGNTETAGEPSAKSSSKAKGGKSAPKDAAKASAESAEGEAETAQDEKATEAATQKSKKSKNAGGAVDTAPSANADDVLRSTMSRAEGINITGKSALDRLSDTRSLDADIRRRAEAKTVEQPEVVQTEREKREMERAKKKKARKKIDFRFRAVIDDTDKVEFVDVYQILNDVFLGKMNVMNYFFIAENSQRINELNFIAIHELANYQARIREKHAVEPLYCLPLTTRFLDDNEELFGTLLNHIQGNGWKKGTIMFSFNASTLESIGPDVAEPWLKKLRKAGYKIVIDGFGEEYNSLDLFADFTFEYLRLSATYFDKTPQKANLLTMLLRFSKSNKFKIVLTDVKTKGQLNRYKKLGVKLMSGKAVSRMSRFVTKRFMRVKE